MRSVLKRVHLRRCEYRRFRAAYFTHTAVTPHIFFKVRHSTEPCFKMASPFKLKGRASPHRLIRALHLNPFEHTPDQS